MSRFLRKTAFLFDLDGTLVDSSGLHERVFREVLLEHAPQILSRFDYQGLKGKSTVDAFRALGIADGGALDALVGEKQQRYRAAVLAGELRLMTGALDLLKLLASRRVRLFVVTGGSRYSVDAALYATGIRGFFEGVITASNVTNGKPAPDGYLLCLKQFALARRESLAIEDSIHGLESAHAAGLETVLVNNPGLLDKFHPSFPSLLEFRRALIADQELVHA